MVKGPLDLRTGDRLVLKKPHPCGSHEWTVYRVGADLGLECAGCGRRVLLPRWKVERRVRRVIRGGPAPGPSGPAGPPPGPPAGER